MKYISLLRGINVSGQKKIKMADLKSLYEDLGYHSVITYIQSGNVIFETGEKDKASIQMKIESAIKTSFKFEVPVILRTTNELKKIIKQNPFEVKDLSADGSKVLVSLLSGKPEKPKVIEIKKFAADAESLESKGMEIYLHCPNGYGKSKLSNAFVETKLGLSATTRNWKTIIKLSELSGVS